MAYDGWIEFNGVELINLARTVQLSELLGLDTVRINEAGVEWIATAVGGGDYSDPAEAPWYDPNYQPSLEFAGIIPLSIPALDDSTAAASTTEYITAGGHTDIPRNATLPIVANVAIVASTERGAEYGKRWMDRVLRGDNSDSRCAASDMRYFRYAQAGSPVAVRHKVRLTRGATVTRKRVRDCSSTWVSTFTLTADDPFEYGEPVSAVTSLGGDPATGPLVASQGSTVLVEEECPVYDYSPVYDPIYPALVAPPAIPDYLPEGWGIVPGATFERFWARLSPVSPSFLDLVPVVTLTTTEEARLVRFSIWPNSSEPEDQCDPLFSVVVSYLPPNGTFYVDGEREASYIWGGFGTAVRRTDSLVFSADANPVEWAAFNDPAGLLVTLDLFADSSEYEGGGAVRAGLALVPKSN